MATKLKTVEDALDELPDDNLHMAMARAFAEIESATKDATNPHFKSKYADLSSVIAAIKPALVKNGLFFYQRPIPAEDGVSVETFVHHRCGQFMTLGTVYVPANKRDPQGFGSALTYAKRYGLQTGFGVPTEDDDGNAAASSYSARPTTGEAPPEKRVQLDGPYTCRTQLQKAAKEFVRTLNSMSSITEFEEWKRTGEVKDFVKQIQRDLPDWWFGGPSVPGDFVPLQTEVENIRRGLAALEAEGTR